MMRGPVWVSGGAGFVGRRLLAQLRASNRPVVALMRTPRTDVPDGVTVVTGDLLQPDTYRASLAGCDTVLHLAAATGKASADEHHRINATATQILLDECRRAGVRRFILVSSIAVTFPDLTDYHYAQAKRRAEEMVRTSGLEFLILRPAIILGPSAPILASLGTLATLPMMLVLGSGRARVQPVHVDDVARVMAETAGLDTLGDQTVEVGGPEVLSMEALLTAVRTARLGRQGPVVHLPLALFRLPLRLAEQAGLGALLPVTAGQLSSFAFDGVAGAHPLTAPFQAGLQPLAAMLGGSPAPGVAAAGDLRAECRTFTRHLLGVDPDAHVLRAYENAVARVPDLQPADAFDARLLAFAAGGAWRAWMADGYAALLAPASALRKRLVMLLAILESRAPFHAQIDASLGSPGVMLVRLVTTSVGAVLGAVLGIAVLLPMRLMSGGGR